MLRHFTFHRIVRGEMKIFAGKISLFISGVWADGNRSRPFSILNSLVLYRLSVLLLFFQKGSFGIQRQATLPRQNPLAQHQIQKQSYMHCRYKPTHMLEKHSCYSTAIFTANAVHCSCFSIFEESEQKVVHRLI